MNEKLIFTKELVKEAKQFILSKMDEDITIDTKSRRNDFVTNVDKGVEQFLIDAIQEKYENQNFVTEEAMIESSKEGDVWVIDPIDGTTNFIYYQQNFAISIGYYEKGEAVFGVVYDVMADEMYWALKGHGAYLNDRKLSKLDQEETIEDAIFSGSLGFLRYFKEDPIEFNQKIIAHRSIGSAAIEICQVASGRAHIYLARRLNLWDVGAALIILNEVGGHWRYGDSLNVLNLDTNRNFFLAASSKHIFNYMNERIQEEAIQ